MKKIHLTVILFLGLILSCTNASEDDLVDIQPILNLVTYDDNVKIIINNNCLDCHISPAINGASVPLLIYENVKSAVQNNNLISKISGNGPGGLMPLGGPMLPQNLIDIIIQWEADGLLEN
jgi:hypothetical protein